MLGASQYPAFIFPWVSISGVTDFRYTEMRLRRFDLYNLEKKGKKLEIRLGFIVLIFKGLFSVGAGVVPPNA